MRVVEGPVQVREKFHHSEGAERTEKDKGDNRRLCGYKSPRIWNVPLNLRAAKHLWHTKHTIWEKKG